MGVVPDQVPGEAVSVLPCSAVPAIVGGAVFAGPTAATTAVAAEVAELARSFDAVTTTRRVDPTSAETSMYVDAAAPAVLTQFAPAVSQRRHWYAKEIGGVPDQAPGCAVRSCPSVTAPMIVGGDVFEGRTSVVVSTTSCGAIDVPASRLLSDIPFPLVEVSATLRRPLLLTSDVTSTLTHCPDAKAPEEPAIVEPGAGAFAYVIVVSPQLLSATGRTEYPTGDAVVEFSRSVAFLIVPESPWRLKRR